MIYSMAMVLRAYLSEDEHLMNTIEIPKGGYVQYFPQDRVWRLYHKNGTFWKELDENKQPYEEIAAALGL